MAATMTSCQENLNLFAVPHHRMKNLLVETNAQIHSTDFSRKELFEELLVRLLSAFSELKQHEEIENKYIMRELKRRLHGEQLQRLRKHLHCHSHISGLLRQVQTVKQELEYQQNELREDLTIDLWDLGIKLTRACEEFFDEYIPHMKEEEQVLQPLMMQFLPSEELRIIREKVLKLHHLKDIEEKLIVANDTVFESIFGQYGQHSESGDENDQVADDAGLITLHSSDDESTESAESSDESTKYFSADETKEENHVVVDTYETSSENSPILDLSAETMLRIFSYLGPKDLCRCAQVNKNWNEFAFTGFLWRHLHVSRWSSGDWRFGTASSEDCNCDCQPNYEMATFIEDLYDPVYTCGKFGPSNDDEDYASNNLTQQAKREAHILDGLSRYVLKRVGQQVKTIIVECGKTISNGKLYRLLVQCPNLEFLDVSQTIISDLGINGLFKGGGGSKMKYFDVSGCRNITDKTLEQLSKHLGKFVQESGQTPSNCSMRVRCSFIEDLEDSQARKVCFQCSFYKNNRALQTLRLSGCYKITNQGLRAMSRNGGLPNLRHLDLSGCSNLTGDGIADLVNTCPLLDPTELYYCDNIYDGPLSDQASPCQNVECSNRVCCRTAAAAETIP